MRDLEVLTREIALHSAGPDEAERDGERTEVLLLNGVLSVRLLYACEDGFVRRKDGEMPFACLVGEFAPEQTRPEIADTRAEYAGVSPGRGPDEVFCTVLLTVELGFPTEDGTVIGYWAEKLLLRGSLGPLIPQEEVQEQVEPSETVDSEEESLEEHDEELRDENREAEDTRARVEERRRVARISRIIHRSIEQSIRGYSIRRERVAY